MNALVAPLPRLRNEWRGQSPWPVGLVLGLLLLTALPAPGAEELVILDETGAKNLGIQTEMVTPGDFEETAFALGHLETIPGREAVVSSRISGRLVELLVAPGDRVEAGAVVARIESRQPGDPPPVVSLTAPLGGLVLEVSARLGEAVEPGHALVEIADLSQLWARARLPEDLAGSLAPGTEANIRIAALPGDVWRGAMLRFGTRVDPGSGTLDAIFQVDNESGQLRPGMRAEYAIVLGRREQVTRVPRSALQGSASNRYLYVKHFDLPNAYVRTPVVVGEMNDRYVEILSGLFPADEVVTQGAYALSFAGGGGGLSLKEALDAAHGHEHAEDGSELTPEQIAARQREHEDPSSPLAAGPLSWVSYGMNLVLLLLLILSARRRSSRDTALEESPASPSEAPH